MLIDSHCHLVDDKYEKSTREILKDAFENGVEKVISIGTSLEENLKNLSLAKEYEGLYCGLGIYPHEEFGKDLSEIANKLSEQIKSSNKVAAVGETGVDISDHLPQRPLKDQQELLEFHLQIAKETKLPIIIHNRGGETELLEMLKPYSSKITGVFHCFTQDWEYAKKVLDLGFLISFTGIITYPKNESLRQVVKKAPLKKIMVETDSPWLPPQGYRGQINYPEYVKITAEKIAQVKEEPYEKIEEVLYENTCAFFDI